MNFMFADGASAIYLPLVNEKPEICLPLFAGIILGLNILLMNLVTAVIVDQAIKSSDEEVAVRIMFHKKQQLALCKDIEKVLRASDANNDGYISLNEILQLDR